MPKCPACHGTGIDIKREQRENLPWICQGCDGEGTLPDLPPASTSITEDDDFYGDLDLDPYPDEARDDGP
jgi:hypothetical protein